MASTITNYSLSIDTQFPVPGQDNDTQGFRNNFSNIQQALGSAADEITNIQIEQIGIVNQLNNIASPTYINANIITATDLVSTTIRNEGTVYSQYFRGDGSGLSNLSVSSITNITNLVSLSVDSLTANTLNGYTPTKFITSAPAASTGTNGHVKGMIYADSSTVYICYRDYVDTVTNIWAKINTVGGTW